MDSSWGAPGVRGGLTIQELGGEEVSLNSFLSDMSGEPIYADADPIYDIVGEGEEEDSGSSTPELLLPPCQVEAEIHPFSDQQTLDMSEKTNSVQIVTEPSASPPISPSPPDVLKTRNPSSPPKSRDKKVGSEKEDASPTTLAPTSTESSQPSESDNSEETSGGRLPPTPSPTPPSLLSLSPSSSPVRASSPSVNLSSTPIPITRNSNPFPTPYPLKFPLEPSNTFMG